MQGMVCPFLLEEYSNVVTKPDGYVFNQCQPGEKGRLNASIREKDAEGHLHSYHKDGLKEQDDLHDLRRRFG